MPHADFCCLISRICNYIQRLSHIRICICIFSYFGTVTTTNDDKADEKILALFVAVIIAKYVSITLRTTDTETLDLITREIVLQYTY